MRVNLHGVFHGIRTAALLIREGGGGVIVNTASSVRVNAVAPGMILHGSGVDGLLDQVRSEFWSAIFDR